MNRTFELRKGKLVFRDDKIVITDNEKRQRNYILSFSGVGILLGGMLVFGLFKNGEVRFSWLGLFIALTQLVYFVIYLLRCIRTEISMNEIKSLELKEDFGNDFLLIKLKNNRTRRVNGIINAERLEEYIATISLAR